LLYDSLTSPHATYLGDNVFIFLHVEVVGVPYTVDRATKEGAKGVTSRDILKSKCFMDIREDTSPFSASPRFFIQYVRAPLPRKGEKSQMQPDKEPACLSIHLYLSAKYFQRKNAHIKKKKYPGNMI
jgi:hypothetical protein